MNIKVAITIVAASFMMVPSAFAAGPSFGGQTGSIGSIADGDAPIDGGSYCSIDPKASFSFSAAVSECSCFLNEAVASGNYSSFFSYLYDNVSSASYSNGVVWANYWASWGFSVVSYGEDTTRHACSVILENRPPTGSYCVVRCRR